MEAKDKAKELVDKYYLLLTEFMENSSIDSRRYYAKQCAIIAVDEILNNNAFPCILESDLICNVEYWQEVKKEIEKL